MCNKQRNLEFRVRSNCQRYITIYFYFYSTKLEEIIIHPVRKKIPRKSEHRGKKSRAQKKRQHDTRPHCQLTARSKYERATFAKGSLNLSSTRVPKQSKPQSVHASRQIFSGPSPVNQAVPNPLSLSLCACFCSCFLPGAATLPRANPFDSSTKARRLFANHVHATDRKGHERLACIHVPPPNLQPFLRGDFPGGGFERGLFRKGVLIYFQRDEKFLETKRNCNPRI